MAGERTGARKSDRARGDIVARRLAGDPAQRDSRGSRSRPAGDSARGRAGSHPARIGEIQLGGRGSERSRGETGHETHYAAIKNEKAGNYAMIAVETTGRISIP